jgi:hypothetical protein
LLSAPARATLVQASAGVSGNLAPSIEVARDGFEIFLYGCLPVRLFLPASAFVRFIGIDRVFPDLKSGIEQPVLRRSKVISLKHPRALIHVNTLKVN